MLAERSPGASEPCQDGFVDADANLIWYRACARPECRPFPQHVRPHRHRTSTHDFCRKTKDIFDRDLAVPESSLDKPVDLNPIGSTAALQESGRRATFAKENANLSENLGRNEGSRIEV